MCGEKEEGLCRQSRSKGRRHKSFGGDKMGNWWVVELRRLFWESFPFKRWISRPMGSIGRVFSCIFQTCWIISQNLYLLTRPTDGSGSHRLIGHNQEKGIVSIMFGVSFVTEDDGNFEELWTAGMHRGHSSPRNIRWVGRILCLSINISIYVFCSPIGYISAAESYKFFKPLMSFIERQISVAEEGINVVTESGNRYFFKLDKSIRMRNYSHTTFPWVSLSFNSLFP